MKYYLIGEIEVKDQSWVQDYVKNVTGMVERSGGRYLARTPQIEKLEGERKPLPMWVILEWPSREAAVRFYESEEYKPYRQRRTAGARNEFMLVAGEDVAKAAHIAE
ncbi:MAG TPA: DUF1330 domain-containing protein [Candidatus Angelobacter sp.]|nr:DUF1330 domain-containing protein [Candidatus Angelobacter sp.]